MNYSTTRTVLAAATALAAFAWQAPAHAQTTLTIGTVNNSDMVRMQGLSSEFEAAHPDIKLDWVTLPEGARSFDGFYNPKEEWPPECQARWKALPQE